jgi:hypothetical protein
MSAVQHIQEQWSWKGIKRKGGLQTTLRQVKDKVDVALFPLSGVNFFLHESIEMVSSYNRSNRLRMQKKGRKKHQVQL